MNNPYVYRNHSSFITTSKHFKLLDQWYPHILGIEVGGLALVIGTLSLGGGGHVNIGVRFVDENDNIIPPIREGGNRTPCHFTLEPSVKSIEETFPLSFHLIVNCNYLYVDIIFHDSSTSTGLNTAFTSRNAPWNHLSISALSVIPLI